MGVSSSTTRGPVSIQHPRLIKTPMRRMAFVEPELLTWPAISFHFISLQFPKIESPRIDSYHIQPTMLHVEGFSVISSINILGRS